MSAFKRNIAYFKSGEYDNENIASSLKVGDNSED